MGFTMVINERGRPVPGAVCDACGDPTVGADGVVFWGDRDTLGLVELGQEVEEVPYTAVVHENSLTGSARPPYTVAVACAEECVGRLHEMFELEPEFVHVDDYIAFFAIRANIDVLDVAGRGMTRDRGPEGEAPPVSE
jgi:hypothetical protein